MNLQILGSFHLETFQQIILFANSLASVTDVSVSETGSCDAHYNGRIHAQLN